MMMQRTDGKKPIYLHCHKCSSRQLIVSTGYFDRGTTYDDGFIEERYQALLKCGHSCDCVTGRTEYATVSGRYTGVREIVDYHMNDDDKTRELFGYTVT